MQRILSFEQVTAETVLQANRSVESMVNTISGLEMILADKIALFRDCICSQEE